jgi:uncharacterized protein (DUF58 family)
VTRPDPTPVWTPTRALGRAVLLTGTLVLLAVVFGRLDLVVLATPFAIGVAWSLRNRPTRSPAVSIGVPADPAAEGTPVQVALVVANPNPVGLDLAVVRLRNTPWLSLPHGDRPYGMDLRAHGTFDLALSGTALRWGYHEIGPAMAYAIACDGLLLSSTAAAPAGVIRVHPLMPAFRADETMPRASALVGVHRSRRPGEGGELAGVRRYGPGDRLRRVDWRVTLRTRELHVAHTLSDRDAEVMVLLDVLHEAGQSGGIHGAATVVDTTVRAAAAITEHYLRQGDRVGLVEYSGQPRILRAAGGRRQLQAGLEWLLRTRATAGAADERPGSGIDPHLIPGSALVVVLTPLLGPQSADMIAKLARAGRVVVAIDTLGEMADQPIGGSQWTTVAQALWKIERDNTIMQLREVGVPVTAWVGAGSLDQVLREMTRMAAAPRIVIR